MLTSVIFRSLAAIGRLFLGFLGAIGNLTLFTASALRHCVTPPFYRRLIGRQMVIVGYYSLPVVGLTALFTGMVLALQSWTVASSRFNAESRDPDGGGAVGITRELGPVLAGLMVAGRIGAAMAAEIGTMRVTEQIDALTTLSTDPFKYLVAPRLIAGTLMLPVLVLVADIVGVFGGYVISIQKLGFNPGRLPRQHVRVPRGARRDFRARQGGGVRLHHRAARLLQRLSQPRRRPGRGRGDDQRRGVGIDPDPRRQLRHHRALLRPLR